MSNDCILWKGRTDKDGYGKISGKLAHRIAFEQAFGININGKELDHICRIRNCVNPLHLRIATRKENMQNSVYRDKTHCKNGHEFSIENTYFWKGLRHCRKCNAEIKRRRL